MPSTTEFRERNDHSPERERAQELYDQLDQADHSPEAAAAMLEAYSGGAEPHFDYGRRRLNSPEAGVMLREWLEHAPDNADSENVLRALSYARESREHADTQLHAAATGFAIARSGGSPDEFVQNHGYTPPPGETGFDPHNIAGFMERHPEDWALRSAAYITAVSAVNAMGEQLTAAGLIDSNPEMVAHGQAMLKTGFDEAHSLSHPVLEDVSGRLAAAWNSRDPGERAGLYQGVYETLLDQFAGDHRDDSRLRSALAGAIADGEHGRRREQNSEFLAQLDYGGGSGPAQALHNISELRYGLRSEGALRDFELELSRGAETERLTELLQADSAWNESMRELSRAYEGNQHELARWSPVHSSRWEPEEHPVPDLAEGLLDQAVRERLAAHDRERISEQALEAAHTAAARPDERLTADIADGIRRYHERRSDMLEAMAHPQALERARELNADRQGE